MKRMAIISDGKVDNIIMVESGFAPSNDSIAIETDTANIGDDYDGKKFTSIRARLSKAELINHATHKFQAAIKNGIPFDLARSGEKPEIVHIPADNITQYMIETLAFVADIDGDDLSLIIKDRVFNLTPDHILKAREAIMRHVVKCYMHLAATIHAIGDGRITSTDEIYGQ